MRKRLTTPTVKTLIIAPSTASVRVCSGEHGSSSLEFDDVSIMFNDTQELAMWLSLALAKVEALMPATIADTDAESFIEKVEAEA